MTDQTMNRERPRSDSFKRWRFLAVLVLLLLPFAFFLGKWSPQVDDAHLEPDRTMPPEGGNFFLPESPLYTEGRIHWGHLSEEELEAIRHYEFESIDPDAIARYLRPNEAALNWLLEALKKPGDWRFSPDWTPETHPGLDMSCFRGQIKALLLLARWRLSRGEDEAAVQARVAAWVLASRVRQGGSPIIGHVVGLALSAIADGAEEADAFASELTNTNALRALVTGLEATLVQPEELAESIRWEYQYQKLVLKEIANGERAIDGGRQARPIDRLTRLAFREKATLRLLVRHSEDWLRKVALPFGQRSRAPVLVPRKIPSLTNFAGERLVKSCSTLKTSGISETHVDLEAETRLQWLAAAIRLCEVEVGRLPETVEALVPDHISRVPLDPFDGRPLRYHPEQRLVYSIGIDLADDGGDRNGKDLVLRF